MFSAPVHRFVRRIKHVVSKVVDSGYDEAHFEEPPPSTHENQVVMPPVTIRYIQQNLAFAINQIGERQGLNDDLGVT